MTIILIDGRVIRPQGQYRMENYGVSMQYGTIDHIIPYSQIKHIFSGGEFGEEEEMYNQIRGFMSAKKRREIKPIGNVDQVSSQDLINQLYAK